GGREDGGRGGREGVGRKMRAGDEGEVLAPAVIVVARNVPRIAVLHAARRMGEDVPDALAAPVFIGRALDLIARGGRAPEEVDGKRVVPGGSDRASRPAHREQ